MLLAGMWRRCKSQWAQSRVISPGPVLQAASLEAVRCAAASSTGPPAPHSQVLRLLCTEGWEKTPIKFRQSYRDLSYSSSTTKATFKSLCDISTGTDYRD